MNARVKICGLNDPASVTAAAEAGADFLGLVFFDKSPRHVTLESARELTRVMRVEAPDAAIVALMVDPTDDDLASVQTAAGADYLQLHGRESVDRVRAIRETFGIKVIKAVGVAHRGDAETGKTYREVADIVLFDAKPAPESELPGGNGLTFDWTLLDGVKDKLPFMLSGGLTGETVADAICLTHAAAVDVSSGVESSPGKKDPELIRRFIMSAKAAKYET